MGGHFHILECGLHDGSTEPVRAAGACPIGGAGLAQETDWRVAMGEITWTLATWVSLPPPAAALPLTCEPERG